ncbi:MAG: porin [Caulobacterales bacterium]|uniref:porin n=1 Tax=Glycocaulis sp. TaxID=1969725 RepID=UPI003FA15842
MTALRAYRLAFIILAAAPISPLALFTSSTQAQALRYGDSLETELTFGADLLFAPGDSSGRAGLLGEVRFGLNTQHTFDNLDRIGFVGGLVLRRDAGSAGFARSVGNCPPALAGCPSAGGLVPAGAFTGFVAGPGVEGDDPALAIETAYLYWRGGFAEVRGGYGPGAASLETEDLPGAFWLMRADGPRVDASGLNLASTTNTLSGYAPKIVVRSVRLAGFRLAASYTPDANICGASYCRPQGVPGLFAGADVGDVAELGLSFDHRFRASGVRWTAGLGLAHGQAANAGNGFYEDPWAVSARIVRVQGPWSAGFSALVSNDGAPDSRYRAESVSLAYERGDWLFSIEASRARAGLADARSETIQAGVSRYFEPGFIIGAGVSHSEADFAAPGAGGPRRESDSDTRAFIEAGLRF